MEIKNYLIENIGEKRYQHSLRVQKVAQELANIYDVDLEKAKTASILHDCAKISDKDILLKKANAFDIINNRVLQNNVELIHAPLGAVIAQKYFNIEDEDVLNAIKFHTTGRVGMSKLEKIIFLADYIEPMRNFDGVDNVRALANKDLDLATIKAMDQTIKFLVDKNSLISMETINARNDLILNL